MNKFLFHILSITIFTWLTYAYIIWKGGFVIDDIEGIANYDGVLPKDACYGAWMKWFRYKVAGKSPRHHHFFNVILKNTCAIMLYFFLNNIIGSQLSFLTTMLFVVAPVGTQAVAWVSGIGYLIGLFMGLMALQIPYLAIPNTFGFNIILYALFTVLAIIGNFTLLATFLITLFLGHYPYVLIGALISIFLGVKIVKQTIALRTVVFKEQNMANSTTFKWRKFIVAVKTLLYYTLLAVFPTKMGLYHKWGFHYEPQIEQEDNRFWLGVLLLIGFGVLFYYGDFIIRFGIIWYFSFIFIFLNWITIHQFVSERYVYIASIGLWIILAKFLTPYPVLYAFILGLYLMRTWQQLPAYQNEITFYQSNVWNFPQSEVALGNLGAVYMKCGLGGSAVDMWNVAIRINPQYDVAYYNIYSALKAQKQWQMARQHLVKSIESPLSHFKDRWIKELAGLDREVIYDNILNSLIQRKEWQNIKKFIFDTLVNQEKTPTYDDSLQEKVFQERLQKELEGLYDMQFQELQNQGKLDDMKQFLIATIGEQTQTPIYKDPNNENKFKEKLQKHLQFIEGEITKFKLYGGTDEKKTT